MSKNIILGKKQQYLVVFSSVVLSLVVVLGVVSGSTTISSNIDTGGSLTVGTTSTLTGVVTASTGLTVTAGGLTVTAGGATVTAGGLTVTAGATSLGSTLAVTGLTTHTAGELLIASSTAVSHFNVSGQLNASSTLTVTGTVLFKDSLITATSTATTTIALQGDSNNATAGEGGCIELRGVDGKMYRMYVGIKDATAAGTTTVRGANVVAFAVWEAGTCQ